MSCIIVVGCYRSGTSMVAGVLSHLGVPMGNIMDPPASTNPTGYFEDIEFKRLFNAMADGRYVGIEEAMQTLVADREREFQIWGIKNPQLCIFLPKLVPLLTKGYHKVISTKRPKDAIIGSLNRSIVGNPDFTVLAEHYLQKKDESLAVYDGPVLEIDYDFMRSRPDEHVKKIAEFVGLEPNKEAVEFIKE